ncbi:MAG: HAMP domain-containing protein [Nitrospiraceae bacterium]|nr:MAG: HAMP domain-containing protein [Nitrospiraceae bacterium]
MFRSLWIKYFLLLASVSLIALSSALLLRELMISDFRKYLEGEMEDRVYWVTASLESTYEKYSGWERDRVIEDTVWALMLGFDVRLYDKDGSLVIDTGLAVDSLSPLIKKRVAALSEPRKQETGGRFVPYALFLGGNEIGQLEVSLLRPAKESLFIHRSNMMLLLSLLLLGGSAIFLSLVFSKKLTRPVQRLTEGVTAISEGNLKKRVAIPGRDEIGMLSDAFNRMAQTLETQESLRKKITSNIAHELRTPMSIIRGELEGMMDGLIPADREHLDSLYAEIKRLMTILEGIEELARAEASSLTLRKREVELAAFLGNIAGRFRQTFEEKGVDLEIRCEDGLAASADPDRLSQIIMNLLSNALKATSKGGHVLIKSERRNEDAAIEVIDSGCGIEHKDLPFVFERFYKGKDGGLGLGLTIVRELVEAHGGQVDVQSVYGRGSSFTVILPL